MAQNINVVLDMMLFKYSFEFNTHRAWSKAGSMKQERKIKIGTDTKIVLLFIYSFLF